MKKTGFLFLVALIVTLSLAVPATAESEVGGKCGDSVNWALNLNTGRLIISGTGKMRDYKEEYLKKSKSSVYTTTAPWGQYYNDIQSVIIQDGVTHIGNYAFSGYMNGSFVNIYEVVIAGSVVDIGDYAFAESGVQKATLKSGIKKIGKSAFSGCSKLKEIGLPETLTQIGESAFVWTGIKEISVPASVTSIGQGALGFNSSIGGGPVPTPGFIIHGYSGTAAETYANSYTFADLLYYAEDYDTSTFEMYYPELYRATRNVKPTDLIFTFSSSGKTAGFIDVKESDWFADAVGWAVANEITNGTGNNLFSPNDTCTTAQIITFLWRAAGTPNAPISNPFSDVNSSDYYCAAAVWAYDKGIVVGDKFNGAAPCTRASTVDFIWKYAGSPASGTANFTDVPRTAPYSKAVAWAVSNSITGGTGNNQFSPDAICTRGQIVTFLYRVRNIKPASTSVPSWNAAYKDFVLAKEFLNAGQEYYVSESYVVMLYDMDKDGMPELILHNGSNGRADRCAYIYTYSDGKVKYLGIGPTDAFFNINGEAGIYGYYRVSGSEITCTLYSKSGMKIEKSNKGTYDDSTWPDNLQLITTALSDTRIKEEGWEAFVAKCGF